MVFPQVPVYLDPPNWHQQLNHHQQGTGSENPQLPVPPPLPTQTDHHHHHNAGPGSIRAGSTSDRARLANKVPQPEAVQKCPRCDSTNTKFCYFNNYSLTQPRHFCKTCRRYWTRGGALRSVPVGGGCRRNKKKKSSSTSSSKSTVSAERQSGSNSANNAVNLPSEITAHFPHQTPPLPNFMASLQSFSQYGMGNIGLNLGGIHSQNGQGDHMGFQIGTNPDILSVRSWNHPQQFPFFEQNDNCLYNPLQSEYMEASASMVGSETQFLPSTSPSPRVSQRGPVKMENNNQGQGINLTRSLMLGASDNQNNSQYWEGNNWTDLSGLK